MIHRALAGSILAAALAAAPAAQEQKPTVDQRVAAELAAQAMAPARAQAVVDLRVTPGRPYSAEATTEFVQALPDGNRITRTTTTRIYRDNEGRTRREQIVDGVVKSVSINDPVAHVSYVLDPEARVAHKSAPVYPKVVAPVMRGGGAGGGGAVGAGGRGGGFVAVAPRSPQPPAADKQAAELEARRASAAGMLRSADANATRESLGQQMIDGVPADGHRTTTVIPAGAIGNVQALKVVSEQWFSPDLEVLVMTKHSDPRSGETTYRLTNIVRGEPDRSLFEVPSDYTVKESGYRRVPAQRE